MLLYIKQNRTEQGRPEPNWNETKRTEQTRPNQHKSALNGDETGPAVDSYQF